MFKLKKWFTLVELIVVIAILAILAVTSFVVLSQWFIKARNIKRVGDLQWLKTALNSYYYSNFKYPVPGEAIEIRDENDEVIWYQGFFDESVWSQMREVTKVPKDPLDKEYYGYSTLVKNGVWYELVAFLEVIDTNLLWMWDKAYAVSLSSRVPYVIGEYQEKWDFHLKPLTFIHPDFGVITSQILWSGGYVKIDTTTLTWYETSGGVVGGVNIEWGELWVADVIEVYPVWIVDPNQVSQALPLVGGVSSTSSASDSSLASNYIWAITWEAGNYSRYLNDINEDGTYIYLAWIRHNNDTSKISWFVSKLSISWFPSTPLWTLMISWVYLKKVIPDGGTVYVFGETRWGYIGSENNDIFAMKLDSNWNILWEKAIWDYNVSNNYFLDALISWGNDIFILGYTLSTNSEANERRLFIRLDTSNWDQILKRYLGSWNNYQAKFIVRDKIDWRMYLAGDTKINAIGYSDAFWSEVTNTWLVLWARHFGESWKWINMKDFQVVNGGKYLIFDYYINGGTYVNILSDDGSNLAQQIISWWTVLYTDLLWKWVIDSTYSWGGVLQLVSQNDDCYGVVFEKDLDNWILWSKRLWAEGNVGLIGPEKLIKLNDGKIIWMDEYGILFKTRQTGWAGYDESLYTVSTTPLSVSNLTSSQIEQSTRNDDVPPVVAINMISGLIIINFTALTWADSSFCPYY